MLSDDWAARFFFTAADDMHPLRAREANEIKRRRQRPPAVGRAGADANPDVFQPDAPRAQRFPTRAVAADEKFIRLAALAYSQPEVVRLLRFDQFRVVFCRLFRADFVFQPAM